MSIRLTLPKIGQTVDGRYKINAEIKGGTYGLVYHGTDLTTGADVAVKVLLPSAASNIAVLQRFEREIQIIQELQHPNIIKIFGAGLSPEGCLYYSMEFLDGLDLGTRLARGHLSVIGAALIAVQTLRALEVAHQHDVIHRDLKPENVYLQMTEARKIRVRVLDFGIAKIVGERGEALPRLTLKNEACGTPSYMAPEQIIGGEITAATDLYSLGLLIHEMLTGEQAVKGASYVDTLRMQVSGEIPLPQGTEGTPMGAVLTRALMKEGAARYQTATDMRVDLETILGSVIA